MWVFIHLPETHPQVAGYIKRECVWECARECMCARCPVCQCSNCAWAGVKAAFGDSKACSLLRLAKLSLTVKWVVKVQSKWNKIWFKDQDRTPSKTSSRPSFAGYIHAMSEWLWGITSTQTPLLQTVTSRRLIKIKIKTTNQHNSKTIQKMDLAQTRLLQPHIPDPDTCIHMINTYIKNKNMIHSHSCSCQFVSWFALAISFPYIVFNMAALNMLSERKTKCRICIME